MDADGDADLFVETPEACCAPHRELSFFFNDGSGAFHPAWSYPLQRVGGSVLSAEIDGKGSPEIVDVSPTDIFVCSNGSPSFLETDCDENGRLDSCDPDADGDGVADACDFCPGRDDRADSDGDGVPDCLPGFEDLIQRGAHRWFVRADADENGVLDLSDPIFTLNHLFRGGRTMGCLRAQDSNDDGIVDLADPLYTLRALFLGGDPIPMPHPDCGRDLVPDGLTCGAYLPCSSW